ncbi:MAG: phage portal protein [Myxococcales bacterium]|nr:phage portal protein [Myxococcales bacterium]
MDPKAIDSAAAELGKVVPLVKAHLVGRERVADSNVVAGVDDAERVFMGTGAIAPPYDPDTLCALLENSNSLRQNIDAYVTNIDAFGHRFEPIIDLDAGDADQRVANAIYIERLKLKEDPRRRDEPAVRVLDPLPTPEEVAAKKREVADLMRMEKSRIENFFEYCCVDSSFVTLRRRTRLDIELLGNGYWEVLRNGAGELVQFVYVPGFTVRLLPLDPELVEIDHKVKISDLSFDTVKVRCRFRRYVQVFEVETVFFKEFGDPRVLSRKNGRVFPNVEALFAADPNDGPATELLHFKVMSPRSAYGVPRWVGNLLAVLGSRQAEEINFLYFENKSVPPLAILVSGGRLSAQSIPRIEDFIENHIRGKRNFHKILILEAEPAGGSGGIEHSGRLKIELRPLTSAQQNDALFQNYDERNIDKVGQSFRLPRMLRGDIRDFNRSTADAALHFAESQVFEPERQEFDFIVNRKILADMGIRFWRFTSKSPVNRDPATMAEIIRNLVNANVLTPEEARQLAGEVFNREFKKISAPWVKQPVPLTLAGVPIGPEEQSPLVGPELPSGKPAPGPLVPPEATKRRRQVPVQDLAAEAQRLIRLRDALREAEARAGDRSFRETKAAEPETEVVQVPAEELRSWFSPGGADGR